MGCSHLGLALVSTSPPHYIFILVCNSMWPALGQLVANVRPTCGQPLVDIKSI